LARFYPSFCFPNSAQHILIGSPQAIAENFRGPAIGPSTAMIFPSYHPEESAKRPDRLRGAKKVVDNFVERP
jgi:hypothetical protein